jgi:hypothetical protein
MVGTIDWPRDAFGQTCHRQRVRRGATSLPLTDPMMPSATPRNSVPFVRGRQLDSDAREMLDSAGADLDEALAGGCGLGHCERVCLQHDRALAI